MADEWTVERGPGWAEFKLGRVELMTAAHDGDVLVRTEDGPGGREVPAAFLAAALRELGWTVTAPVTP
jgi:hypothetical protein